MHSRYQHTAKHLRQCGEINRRLKLKYSAGRQAGRKAGRQAGTLRQAGWLAGRQAGRQPGRQAAGRVRIDVLVENLSCL